MERTASGLSMLRSSLRHHPLIEGVVIGVLFASLQCAGERVPVVMTGDDERNRGRERDQYGRTTPRTAMLLCVGVSPDHTHEQIRACARVLALQEGELREGLVLASPEKYSHVVANNPAACCSRNSHPLRSVEDLQQGA